MERGGAGAEADDEAERALSRHVHRVCELALASVILSTVQERLKLASDSKPAGSSPRLTKAARSN
eukprot:4370962-Pyramimonas_sp.AAC.1